MATTTPISQPYQMGAVDVIFMTLAANTTIPKGALAVNDAGVAKNATSALAVAGAKLLGFASETYTNATGSSITVRMLFLRGCAYDAGGKAGDLPTAANIGGNVFVHDNNSVKATDAGGDIPAILTKIVGSTYSVRLP